MAAKQLLFDEDARKALLRGVLNWYEGRVR